MTDIKELFRQRYIEAPSGCWIWIAARTRGYGVMRADGANWKAHRLAYALIVGPIPDGLTIDHLCRVKRCVNPMHLEPVTLAENLRRAVPHRRKVRKTHCPQGHRYAGENLMLARTGEQLCRECKRQHTRRYRREALA